MVEIDDFLTNVVFADPNHRADHGIKDQKWGVRQGPPYPLGNSARSSAEKSEANSNSKYTGTSKEASTVQNSKSSSRESSSNTSSENKSTGSRIETKETAYGKKSTLKSKGEAADDNALDDFEPEDEYDYDYDKAERMQSVAYNFSKIYAKKGADAATEYCDKSLKGCKYTMSIHEEVDSYDGSTYKYVSMNVEGKKTRYNAMVEVYDDGDYYADDDYFEPISHSAFSSQSYIAHYVFDDPNHRADHGIKGQHWGVRRYQNSDGSLTAEGRLRYSETNGEIRDKAKLEKATASVRSSNPTYNKDAVADKLSENPKVTKAVSRIAQTTGRSEKEVMGDVVNGKYSAEVDSWNGERAEKAAKVKKAVIIGAGAAALAAGAIYYGNNKEKCDKAIANAINDTKTIAKAASKAKDSYVVKGAVTSFKTAKGGVDTVRSAIGQKRDEAAQKTVERRNAKEAETQQYVNDNKRHILRDARLVKKYSDYLTDDELQQATKRLDNMSDINDARKAQIKLGAEYIDSVLKYGSAATAVYGLYKSELGQEVKKKVTSKVKKEENQNGEKS